MFRHPRDIIVWLVWFLTYSIGWGIGIVLLSISAINIFYFDPTTGSILPPDLIDFVLFHGTIWGGIGVTQWVVLRIAYFPKVVWWSPWWVLVTVVGWVCFWLLTHVPPLPVDMLSMLLVWALAGMLIGLLEWFVLRRYVAGAIIWLCAHPVALGTMALLHWVINPIQLQVFGSSSTIGRFVDIMLPGMVYGSVIGFFLVFLLQRASPRHVLTNYSHYQPGE
ncbi:MAG: hypothetical protein GFH27_549321n120 [Chloroflexi bacterium AL-W]|nr:hypothetical protein [Chloroflexi bacterium AL-N1]NOK64998.1 hypothetical protein [Chloroflexi bacterium AL-N10]NOK76768.1 hypothetical protein [Chloroflexi bacterium AL-N5]NOK84659.1 hypothetical protein [Chloroflexi bacterium AL-W]NOK86516.1 hypothetical protein [Chloroflexi bacterium AL-N15]